MAVSLNSVTSFNPTTNYQQGRRVHVALLSSNIPSLTSLSRSVGLRHSTQEKKSRLLHIQASGGDNVTTETTDNDSKSIDVSSPINPSEASNGAITPTDLNPDPSSSKPSSGVKRATLTARERLRAARVLSRYTDSKPAKPELGSRLIDALKESDKGKKRPGLPQAPTNIFDDSKRGMPKDGWTIELPGGMDVFFIILSFVLISTAMFATTYVVWKVGAIHFNES